MFQCTFIYIFVHFILFVKCNEVIVPLGCNSFGPFIDRERVSGSSLFCVNKITKSLNITYEGI